jgi:serpin B
VKAGLVLASIVLVAVPSPVVPFRIAAAMTPQTAPANFDAFGLALLKRLTAPSSNRNIFISPIGLGLSLSMAVDGAAGPTRKALLAGLQISGERLSDANAALISNLRENQDAKVGMADALWFRRDRPPRQSYVRLVASHYGARAQALTFGLPSAARAINAWTKSNTLGLVDHVIDKTSALDFAYLTNAIAFKAAWTSRFDALDTRAEPFTEADGKRHPVRMMLQEGSLKILDAREYRSLRLPYGKGGYAAYIILPNSNLDHTLKRLSLDDFSRIATRATSQPVYVQLPRFTITYGASLVPVLTELGMGPAFRYSLDFSPMQVTPQPLRIESVLHRTYVRVDEGGTTAAGGSAVELRGKGQAPRGEVFFIVNRPFILAIRDEHNGSLLFLGAIRHIP